jgi:hypothetical protein
LRLDILGSDLITRRDDMMSRTEPPRSGTWDDFLDGFPEPGKGEPGPGELFTGSRVSTPWQFGLRHLLMVVVLAGLLFMSARSLLAMNPIGILIWPILLGFGIERTWGGHGVVGGTIGGVLTCLAANFIASSRPGLIGGYWSDPLFCSLTVLSLGAGTCSGFYLSVWVYLLVETLSEYF